MNLLASQRPVSLTGAERQRPRFTARLLIRLRKARRQSENIEHKKNKNHALNIASLAVPQDHRSKTEGV